MSCLRDRGPPGPRASPAPPPPHLRSPRAGGGGSLPTRHPARKSALRRPATRQRRMHDEKKARAPTRCNMRQTQGPRRPHQSPPWCYPRAAPPPPSTRPRGPSTLRGAAPRCSAHTPCHPPPSPRANQTSLRGRRRCRAATSTVEVISDPDASRISDRAHAITNATRAKRDTPCPARESRRAAPRARSGAPSRSRAAPSRARSRPAPVPCPDPCRDGAQARVSARPLRRARSATDAERTRPTRAGTGAQETRVNAPSPGKRVAVMGLAVL